MSLDLRDRLGELIDLVRLLGDALRQIAPGVVESDELDAGPWRDGELGRPARATDSWYT
jgi:hypothetical protein